MASRFAGLERNFEREDLLDVMLSRKDSGQSCQPNTFPAVDGFCKTCQPPAAKFTRRHRDEDEDNSYQHFVHRTTVCCCQGLASGSDPELFVEEASDRCQDETGPMVMPLMRGKKDRVRKVN
ncbi:hypothetical protein HPP92_028923 [Vanilla planifolia]|uniref:Uncharacterized protein n=1 Tax=Vanilla planifolia TaxID=51239 RepID=A0A835P7D2_VANPL|nr:hypothetical protein HPP92_028913 [Vanilla planifolia]KAG0446276.1 hypothetical protein HPP92_028923 [Vanilla planifolia]